MTATPDPSRPGLLGRRRFLGGGAAALGGLAAAGAGYGVAEARRSEPEPPAPPDRAGSAVEPFHGSHQAGVDTAQQAATSFVALDLSPGTDRTALARLLRLWTDDAARLTAGRPALADTEPELATVPARLTVTVGFGPGVFALDGLAGQRPQWLRPLPAFPVDRLEDRWSGGDLLLHLGSDDPVTLAHARRMLLKDARVFAGVRWVQNGFHRSPGTTPPGLTARNLMGQVDGTVNPAPGSADLDAVVWVADDPPWLSGGTGLALRRIRMALDRWDGLDRRAKEAVIGRRLDTGAPLTGTREHDVPDLAAVGPDGLPVIADFAHVRLAHGGDPQHRFLRRPVNYDDGVLSDGTPDLGLLFTAYAADLERQLVPVQARLAAADLLNTWTTSVGSAVFALPPGCGRGGWLGETLLG